MIGVLLAALGLSGTLLIYEDAWLRATVPGASESLVQDIDTTIAVAERLLESEEALVTGLRFPTESLGLYRLSYENGAGAYADQSGTIVAHWASTWDRLELWLFDFHHHLFFGRVGSTLGGVLALIGLGFAITGPILWWRSRKSFAFRLLPASFSRNHIVRHHRDLGVLTSPMLVLACLTGAMLTLRPVASFVLAPLPGSESIAESLAPPTVAGGALSAEFDWGSALRQAHQTYPNAELRTVGAPRRPGQLVRIRVRQPGEWLPNGRTVLWFDGANGRLIEARDARSLPLAGRAFNLVYPLHAASVGGWIYKAAMTITGIALTLLGSFAVWSFGGFQARRARLRANAAADRVAA